MSDAASQAGPAATQKTAYPEQFTEDNFWAKLSKSALSAGRDVVQKALSLYYSAIDPQTPAWAKGVIAGALGYFILPIDAIPDIIPGVGYTDDFAVLAAATITVVKHIKPEHLKQAEEMVNRVLAKLPFAVPTTAASSANAPAENVN